MELTRETGLRKQSFWWVWCGAALLPGLVSLLGVLQGFSESLWVDELHTSWCVAGPWDKIASRAAAGNQSPWYFYLVRFTLILFGTSEFTLRLPSAMAYGLCCLALVCWLRWRWRQQDIWLVIVIPALVAIGTWLVLDRTAFFYASEARGYATLMAVNLLGWLLVDVAVVQFSRAERIHLAIPAAWLLSAACGVSLHLTALLPVACQVLVLVVSIAWWRPVGSRVWLAAIVICAVCCMPALLAGSGVWTRRSQWESFAGDASWAALGQLFSWWIYFVALGLVWLTTVVDHWHRGRKAEAPLPQQTTPQQTTGSRWLWLAASVGPVAIAWWATFLGIAPLLHQRYVICCAIPLMILCIDSILRLKQAYVAWLAVLLVSAALIATQGWSQAWSHGQLLGSQRPEDWRAAATWIEAEAGPSDQVWVASGLIEGANLQPPIDPKIDEYLSYPLRGIYYVETAQPPRALVGDANFWLVQLLEDDREVPRREVGARFIVARCPAGILTKILERLRQFCDQNEVDFTIETEARSYGLVSGAKVRVAWK